MVPDKSIMEKIQKLLSLANSDNENEAKMATARANELLIKYNLNLQQIEDHQNDYMVQTIEDKNAGLTLKPHHNLIADLLMEFFFVKIMIQRSYVGESSGRWARRQKPRSQYKKVIQLVGTEENCKIAGYIFSYLNTAYPHLWKEYFDTHADAEARDKQSYYTGLTIGIKAMLDETKWKVLNETGLVLKDDPKLKEFLKTKSTGTYGGESNASVNAEVVKDGIEDGKNVKLRKPLDSQTATDSGRSLTGRK